MHKMEKRTTVNARDEIIRAVIESMSVLSFVVFENQYWIHLVSQNQVGFVIFELK